MSPLNGESRKTILSGHAFWEQSRAGRNGQLGYSPGPQSGTTAVTSISTLARDSISPLTSTQVMAGKFLPITSR